MHNVGSMILALLYLGAGGCLGEVVRRVWQNRTAELFDPHWYFWAIVVWNVLALTCLALLRQRAQRKSPLERLDRPWRVLIHGLPVTERIAVLLFSTTYLAGLFVGLAFA